MHGIYSTIYDRLGDLLVVIWYIRVWCGNTANWCRDGGIIRNWAEPVFRTLEDFFSDVWNRIRDVKMAIPEIVDFLNALWDGWGLNDLINRVFWEWNNFRSAPTDWVKGKLTILIPGFGMLMADPWQWMKNVLFIYYRGVYDFLQNPWWEFLNWVQDYYPHVYRFFTDAVSAVVNLIDILSAEAYALVTDPKQWLKDKFLDLTGWSTAFWSDPWWYLFGKILDYIDLHIANWAAMLSRSGERIIRYIWEGQI